MPDNCARILIKVNREVEELASRDAVMNKEGDSHNKYSVLLPTYEERENLPLVVWLLVKYFEKRFSLHAEKTI